MIINGKPSQLDKLHICYICVQGIVIVIRYLFIFSTHLITFSLLIDQYYKFQRCHHKFSWIFVPFNIDLQEFCTMASKNILQDNEIEDLLFLTPPEGSEDELEDFNIDELVCENYDTDTYDHNDDNVDIIDLPDLDQNIFIPNNDLDSIELADPILIVVPNSESLNLMQPLVNSTKTTEVSVVHTPTVDKINTTKRTKFREIKSVVWKKRPFQISPDEIKFKGDTSLPQDPFFDLESPLDFFNYFFSSDLLQHICEESLRYSLQKNVNKPFEITETDLKRYLGICIMTSICIVRGVLGGVRHSGNTGLPAQIKVEYEGAYPTPFPSKNIHIFFKS